jgi:hypothetical protein
MALKIQHGAFSSAACFSRVLKNDWNSHFTVKTPWGRHPGEGRGPVFCLKNQIVQKSPGFRPPDWTLPGQAPPE